MMKKFDNFSIDQEHINKMRRTPDRSVDKQFSKIMVDNLMSTDEKTSQKWSTYNAIKI